MKRGMTPTALSLARQSGHLPRFRAVDYDRGGDRGVILPVHFSVDMRN